MKFPFSRVSILSWFVFLAVTQTFTVGCQNKIEVETGNLEMVVVVMRHGVRSPGFPPFHKEHVDRPRAKYWSRDKRWPDFGVARNQLTLHGYNLVERLGAYYRTLYLGRTELLSKKDCPVASRIYVRADNCTRDVETAEAFLKGFMPDCRVPVHHFPVDTKRWDPLFYGLDLINTCTLTEAARRKAIKGRIGTMPDLIRAYRKPLQKIQDVLGCCSPEACPTGDVSRCTLFDIPSGLRRNGDFFGTFFVGHEAAEAFMLEAAQGFPRKDIGWGRVSNKHLLKMLKVHLAYYDVLFRTPLLARKEGSNLLAHILVSIQQRLDGMTISGLARAEPKGRPPTPETRFLLYVAHDVTLDSLAGLLDLHWHNRSFLPDHTPPGGGIVLEVYRDAGFPPNQSRTWITASFLTQTLDQMAESKNLSPASPPSRSTIPLAAFSKAKFPQKGCSYHAFRQVVLEALDMDCVEPALRPCITEQNPNRHIRTAGE